MTIQNYDIQIAAGGTQMIEAAAQILDFVSSGSAFDQIKVQPDVMQGAVTLKLGQGFDAGAIVQRWLVTNPGATAINGTVVLSTAGFRNFRISGDVNVIDGGKSRSLQGLAFSMYGQQVAPGAGQYARVQLWNKPTSPNRLVLEGVTMTGAAGAASSFYIFNQTQLANLAGMGICKRASLPASANAGVYYDSTAQQPTMGQDAMSLSMPAATAFNQRFFEPLVIDPGYGLVMWAAGSNLQIGCTFEWFEEPNT